MIVYANHKLWQVQKKFHDVFPFLRLEFTRMDDQNKHEPIYLNKTLLEECHVEPGTLLIADKDEKFNWLRFKFKSIFHINIKVYKKIGRIRWKELTEAEPYNLYEINAKCEKMNMPDK